MLSRKLKKDFIFIYAAVFHFLSCEICLDILAFGVVVCHIKVLTLFYKYLS